MSYKLLVWAYAYDVTGGGRRKLVAVWWGGWIESCVGVNPSRFPAVLGVLLVVEGGELICELLFEIGEFAGDRDDSSVRVADSTGV